MSIKPITFLVPALNEEKNIEATVQTILQAMDFFRMSPASRNNGVVQCVIPAEEGITPSSVSIDTADLGTKASSPSSPAASLERSPITHFACDYEILLVNDGSTDETPRLMDQLARENKRVRVIHNKKNLGLGGAYKRGIEQADKEYIMWISGDNAETADHIINIISHVGEADIVVPVLKAGKTRPWIRRFISRTFTLIVNFLFGLKVNYYNGTVVHRRSLIRSITIRSNSFAFQAESLVKLLKKGATYVEVPYSSATYDGMFSYAMRPKNLIAVLKTLVVLFFEIRNSKRI